MRLEEHFAIARFCKGKARVPGGARVFFFCDSPSGLKTGPGKGIQPQMKRIGTGMDRMDRMLEDPGSSFCGISIPSILSIPVPKSAAVAVG